MGDDELYTVLVDMPDAKPFVTAAFDRRGRALQHAHEMAAQYAKENNIVNETTEKTDPHGVIEVRLDNSRYVASVHTTRYDT